MRAAHGLALAFVLAIGALSGTLLVRLPTEHEDPTQPDQGVLAPLPDHLPDTKAIAHLGGEAGRVQDLAVSGSILAVLTSDHWFIQTGDTLLGGFGDPSPGSPDWLSRPVSIAVGKSRVYILDAGRFVLSIWDMQGTRLEDVRLSPGEDFSFQPTQVVLGPEDEPVVLSFRLGRDGVGRWEAQAYGEGETGRLVFALDARAPFAVFDRPILARHMGDLLGINALDHAVFRVGPGLPGPVPYLQRRDPPLWKVPSRIRREYDGMLRGMGGGPTAGASGLPEMWPSVRDFAVTPEGSLLVAISAGEEPVHLELLDGEAIPMWRFSPNGFLEPVFLDAGRAFLVRENLNETVIHEFIIQEG